MTTTAAAITPTTNTVTVAGGIVAKKMPGVLSKPAAPAGHKKGGGNEPT